MNDKVLLLIQQIKCLYSLRFFAHLMMQMESYKLGKSLEKKSQRHFDAQQVKCTLPNSHRFIKAVGL